MMVDGILNIDQFKFEGGGIRDLEIFYCDSSPDSKDLEVIFVFHNFSASSNVLDWWSGLFGCLLYTSPSPRDLSTSRMPSSA